jgi:putative transposase
MAGIPTRHKRGPDLRPRRSQRARGEQGGQFASAVHPQDTDIPIEIGRLYALEGRLVCVVRRDEDGKLLVQDQIDGAERRVSAGFLAPRPLDTAVAAQSAAASTEGLPAAKPEVGASMAEQMSPLTDSQKETALKRLNVIQPLIDQPVRTAFDVNRVAHQAKLSATTVYRWLRIYFEGGLSALAPKRRGLAKGTVLIDARVEQVIESTIREAFDAGESGATVSDLLPTILTKCDQLGTDTEGKSIKYPGEATIQRRLTRLRCNYRNHKGETRKAVREANRPVTGSVDADHLLHVVEIDHTVMDVHAVDEETFEPIGRPTFTVAIDDFTRCVLAFFLSLLPPSALAAAMCLQRMRFPKEAWLKEIGLERLEWPMYGAPEIVQVDHGSEFMAPAFAYGCHQMHAEVRPRPIAQPRYGGTVERLIGTLMRKLRLLPGATYNDMLKKATRKPIRDAHYTPAGLEWEIARQIGLYHDQRHDALGMTPRQAWDRALAAQGWLAPSLPGISPELFVIEFMPLIERTVSRKGVGMSGGRRYWAEELRPLVHLRQSVLARPDPRDVRHLWLKLPDQEYVRSHLYQPRDFSGITAWDFRVWQMQRRGPRVLNHVVHAALLDESRERRTEAAAKVRAHRNTAKTVTQTRRSAVQNRIFQQEYRTREAGKDPFDVAASPGALPEGPTDAPAARPKLTIVRTLPDEPDLSKLKATPGFVFRRNPRRP